MLIYIIYTYIVYIIGKTPPVCGFMDEFVRIPEERIGVLIGPQGAVKREIEKKTGTRIEIDSESGEVEISSKKGDALQFYKAGDIVRAIARGFSPEHAFSLLKEGFILEIIKITEYAGKSEKAIAAKRARVIGKQGTAREEIERNTGCFVSVYGKTISIIGSTDKIEKAIKAVGMLIEGAKHSTAFGFLKNNKKKSDKFEL